MFYTIFCSLFAFLSLIQTVETVDILQDYNLRAHNVIRHLYGVPDLELDQDMCRKAESFAKMMALRGKGLPEHSTKKFRAFAGENLSVRCHALDDPFGDITFPTQKWYKELCKNHYDFNLADDNPQLSNTNRFTQMVWKNSRKLGIGEAYGSLVINGKPLRCKYTVAWYKPAGNVPGKYKDNVIKATEHGNECNRVSSMLTDANFDEVRSKVKHGIMNNSTFTEDIMENNERDRSSVGKEEKPSNDDKSDAKDSFEKFHLDAHNRYRNIHGAPPMTLNSTMSKEAEEYAKKLVQLGTLQHASNSELDGQGENLAKKCSSSKDLKDDFATENWYNEVCKPGYTFGSASNMPDLTGHFTQVVWKASVKLGIGKATSKENGMTCIYVVGRYSPAGNWFGDYNKNVLKGSFDKDKDCNQTKEDEKSDKEDLSKDNSKDDEKDLFEKFHLDAHNRYRNIHGAPPMTLNSTMSKEAEEYAKKLVQLGTLQHSSPSELDGQGENLAKKCSSSKNLKDDFATENWYNEVCKPGYTFGSASNMPDLTGHFTQVVWKASVKLGIGKATSKENGMTCIYVVGRYSPAGNWFGEYNKNVFKGSFDKDKDCKITIEDVL